MTTRTQRIEVITRGERRRRWSIEEKREIVAESLRPGIRPSEVIRKHGISSGQLYAWRQQLTRRLGDEVPGRSANFARVDVVVAQRQEKTDPVGDTAMVAVARPQSAAPMNAWPRAEGLIEIVLPNGASVRVDVHVDARALRRVLGALVNPAYWRAQAAEARTAAADMADPKAKRTVEKIAASYEMLARRAEKSSETASYLEQRSNKSS